MLIAWLELTATIQSSTTNVQCPATIAVLPEQFSGPLDGVTLCIAKGLIQNGPLFRFIHLFIIAWQIHCAQDNHEEVMGFLISLCSTLQHGVVQALARASGVAVISECHFVTAATRGHCPTDAMVESPPLEIDDNICEWLAVIQANAGG